MNKLNVSNNLVNVETLIDDTIDVPLVVEESEIIDVELLEDINEINISANENHELIALIDNAVTNISSIKHNELQNKDLPNQHNISSITGLQNELDTLNYSINRNIQEIANLHNEIDALDNKIETSASLAMPYISKDSPAPTKTNIWFDISITIENDFVLNDEPIEDETFIEEQDQLIT